MGRTLLDQRVRVDNRQMSRLLIIDLLFLSLIRMSPMAELTYNLKKIIFYSAPNYI